MLITHKHIDENFEYTGSQIDQSWAFKSFGIKGSNIITWIGSMNILLENLKDFEDFGLEIKSDKMIHFVIEHFDQQPANLRLNYMRQRLLVMILQEELAKKGISAIRKGDDIYIGSNHIPSNHDSNSNLVDDLYKLTVSIATVSPSSMKIHLGINITTNGTPEDINTVGLFDLIEKNGNDNYKYYFNNDNILDFINFIVNTYIDELNDIESDISKTKLL